jgi:hypothetical protein
MREHDPVDWWLEAAYITLGALAALLSIYLFC